MPAELRAQGAMEYLSTYGWALLVVLILILALFGIGLFTAPTSGSNCAATEDYSCSQLVLAKAGSDNISLSFVFGQNTGAPIFNIGMACSASATAGGLPNPASNTFAAQNTIVYLNSNGIATANGIAGGVGAVVDPLDMASGATITVSDLMCYDAAADAGGAVGLAITPTTAPVGSLFTGTIYMNYTVNGGAPTVASGSNPIYTVPVASITTRIA